MCRKPLEPQHFFCLRRRPFLPRGCELRDFVNETFITQYR